MGDDVNEPATTKRRVEAILQENAAYTTVSAPPSSPVGISPPFAPLSGPPLGSGGSGSAFVLDCQVLIRA